MTKNLAISGGKPVRKNPIFYSPVIEQDEIDAVVNLLKTKKITALSSNVVKDFEGAFARHVGAKHCVAMNSGTAVLHTAVAACGIGPGDEVIVPAYTFVATASCVLHHNAIPVFADIDPETYCLDPKDVERKITEKTKAILPVHLFGYPADMGALKKIAGKNKLRLIEDAAQAHGTVCEGKKAGTIGDIGCFSLQESKNITTGEGGLLVTDNDEMAGTARLVRHHGQSEQYKYVRLGWNYRMTGMEAAIGIVQLKKLERLNKIRKEMAESYRRRLGGIGGFVLPKEPGSSSVHSYHVYAVRIIEEKLGISADTFIKAMAAEGVRTPLIYPEPLYLNPLFADKSAYPKGCPFSCPFYGKNMEYRQGSCPNADKVTREMIRLPLHPAIPMEDLNDVAEAVLKIVENKGELV